MVNAVRNVTFQLKIFSQNQLQYLTSVKTCQTLGTKFKNNTQ